MREGLRAIRHAFASREPANVARLQRARFAEMVAFARARSPYYRELYRNLPERVEDPRMLRMLPTTDKPKLMSRFDEWVTDHDATLDKVSAFVGNPELIGERFLGKYTVLTTSGTTGTSGTFLLDDHAMAVSAAMLLRMASTVFGLGDRSGPRFSDSVVRWDLP